MKNADEVNEELRNWRQGDVIGNAALPFLYFCDAHLPLTSEAQEEVTNQPAAADDGLDLRSIAVEPPGFVVLTQTCDLVRDCRERPFVELSPLIQVSQDDLLDIEKGIRPIYASIPSQVAKALVADLDRSMTVEKAVLANLPKDSHVAGFDDDGELRKFARAIARKKMRYAFPDDFIAAVRPFQEHIKKKHGKDSPQGRFLSTVREIRVKVAPNWTDVESLTFYFLLQDGALPNKELTEEAKKLVERIKPGTKYSDSNFRVVSPEQMSVAAYLTSDQLDLDHLSY